MMVHASSVRVLRWIATAVLLGAVAVLLAAGGAATADDAPQPDAAPAAHPDPTYAGRLPGEDEGAWDDPTLELHADAAEATSVK